MHGCPRQGCHGRLRRLGEDNTRTYWACKQGHFARSENGVDESEAMTEIGGLQVPGTISLTGMSLEAE